jgi:hypothetical protein
LAAAVLHVIAILLYVAVIRHDLVTPMITGWKTLPQDAKPPPRLVNTARAALLLGCSALAAAALATYL